MELFLEKPIAGVKRNILFIIKKYNKISLYSRIIYTKSGSWT
jgi:hypothetical protein